MVIGLIVLWNALWIAAVYRVSRLNLKTLTVATHTNNHMEGSLNDSSA